MNIKDYWYRGRGSSRVLYLRGAWKAWIDGPVKEYAPSKRHKSTNAATVRHCVRCLSGGAYATKAFRTDGWYGVDGHGGYGPALRRIARQEWRESIERNLKHAAYRAGLEVFPQPHLRFAIVSSARHALAVAYGWDN